MGYCSVSDVRLISNLSTTDISNADVISMISIATAELNRQINTTTEKMKVHYLDSTRRNTIDGANVTFNTDFYPLADYDNDGDVDISDIIVYDYDPTGVETQSTVSAVTESSGQFVLSSAPASGHTVKVTYSYAPQLITTAHALIKEACAELVCGLAYTKVEAGRLENFQLGKLRVNSPTTTGAKKFYDQYYNTVRLINARLANIMEG